MDKRAVLYAREASDPSHSACAQLDACCLHSTQRGYQVIGEFVDDDRAVERPAFDALRVLIAKGGADVVVCYTFDRLVRSPGDLQLIRHEFLPGQVEIECVHWDWRID